MESDKATNNVYSITDEFEENEHQVETENPDFIQDQLSTLDAQEVVNIFSDIISHQMLILTQIILDIGHLKKTI